MIRCLRCVMPNTRPDTPFVDGVCAACLSYERRPDIDWDVRKAALLELLDQHDGNCIVPSSGGKDSTYQVLQLLELGAKPLVVTASTCHLSAIGRKNIDNLGRYAETIEVTTNRKQRAHLNRLGLEMVGDISWPEHVAIFTIPWRVAHKLGVPLLFYGENPQDQYGGPPGTEDALTMTRRWVSEFGGFLGLRPSDMATLVDPSDMTIYTPPADAELEAHFLGQYIPWDSRRNAAQAVAAGMQTMLPCSANWWDFENLDNLQTGLHDWLMYRKFGYGRGCAQISVDVRAGVVSRAEALEWVRAHDGRFPHKYLGVDVNDVLDQVGVRFADLLKIANQFTQWDLFCNDGERLVLKEAA